MSQKSSVDANMTASLVPSMEADPSKAPLRDDSTDIEASKLEKLAGSSSLESPDDPLNWFTPEEGRKIKHKIDRRLVLILGAM